MDKRKYKRSSVNKVPMFDMLLRYVRYKPVRFNVVSRQRIHCCYHVTLWFHIQLRYCVVRTMAESSLSDAQLLLSRTEFSEVSPMTHAYTFLVSTRPESLQMDQCVQSTEGGSTTSKTTASTRTAVISYLSDPLERTFDSRTLCAIFCNAT